jgi:hypothetical protein
VASGRAALVKRLAPDMYLLDRRQLREFVA